MAIGREARSARWLRAAPCAVAALTVAGLLLRVPSFDDSLFGDELSTYYAVTGHGLRRAIGIVRSDQELTPPLYYALAWLAVKLGGSAQWLRLASLVGGVATIPVTYLIGVRTVGSRAAVVGAALVALSPFLIFYSTEARAYALMMFLAALSTLALLRALGEGRARWWAAYALCACAALYTHYTVAFLLVGQALWALWTHPRVRAPLLVASGAAAAGMLPWLPEFLADRRSACANLIGALQPFGPDAVRMDIGRWAVGHPISTLALVPGAVGLALVIAGLGTGVLGAGLRWRSDRRVQQRPSSAVVLVVVLALALPVGVALASVVGSSVFTPRNLIASWPGLALAAGAVLSAGPAPIRLVAPALVLAGFAVGATAMLVRRHGRPDYAAAVAFVARTGGPSDALVDEPYPTPGPLTAVDVALTRLGRAHPPVLRLGAPSLATQLRARLPGGPGACASAFLPAPPGQLIARRTAEHVRRGSIFLVAFGAGSLADVRRSPRSPLATFVAALPSRFHLAETRTFPGFGGAHSLWVYVFRDNADSAR